MPPKARLALLIVAITVVVLLLITSPWSSEENHDKQGLLSRVSKTLEEGESPPELTNCLIGALAKNLSDEEVEGQWTEVEAGDDSAQPSIDMSPQLQEKVSGYGLLCLQRVARSGRYKPEELSQLLRP
jgi:hypothetical protein